MVAAKGYLKLLAAVGLIGTLLISFPAPAPGTVDQGAAPGIAAA